MKSFQIPIFEPLKAHISNDEINEKLLPFLFDSLIDMSSGARRCRKAHPRITFLVLLAKNYEFESFKSLLDDENKLDETMEFLIYLKDRTDKLSKENLHQALMYLEWHEDSRNVTDHLREEMHVSEMLERILKLFDYASPHGEYTTHNIFTKNSTIGEELK